MSAIRLSAQPWTETQKIITSDRAAEDYFGSKVSISGNFAAIGAPFEDDDANGANFVNAAGAVYIFQKDEKGTWHEVQKIVASDRAASDYFGNYVSLSGDYLIAGARLADYDANGGNYLSAAGAAYIFERNTSGVWVEVQKLVAADRGEDDFFGAGVAIDQNYAVVGAFNDEKDANGGNPIDYAGSAYFFERNQAGTWIQVQKVVSTDRSLFDWFGVSVDISGDYAVIGSMQDAAGVNGGSSVPQAGSAYIFERGVAGGWNMAQKIVADDRTSFSSFGVAVAIDSNRIVVGAHQEDYDTSGTNPLENAGAAYIYERDIVGDWHQIQKISNSDRAVDDFFGGALAIDGDWIIAGLLREDEDTLGMNTLSDAGSAYLFQRDSLTSQWSEVQKIVPAQRHEDARFGGTVDIEDTLVMVGSQFNDFDANGGNFLDKAGAAYVFQIPVEKDTTGSTGLTPNQLQKALKVYPNPANGQLSIELGRYYSEVEIRLRNVLGQVVVRQNFNATDKIKIDLPLSPEVYVLEVDTHSEIAGLKVVVIR
ncbi:MAG: T9SS type A sorting domain-containing protein [Bacteroidetes bacterium]|nr:T9SS type A sorting domain-containing protein [Bacteroidota bacterium]